MFEGLLLPWQQIYHLAFFRTTPEVSSKLYFVEICQVSEELWLLITKELIFGFQILDLKDHFSASLINFSIVILIHKAFYSDSSDKSYLSTLMVLLIHLDLFSKHIASQGNVHLQFCLFREHFASTEV